MKKKVRLCLSAEEYRLVLRSLMELKNDLIRQGRYTDCVDDLLLKFVFPVQCPDKIIQPLCPRM